MAEKPKLENVAREAGVSVATASQVLRGAGRISGATRKKVLAAAERLHYVPDGRAAAMRSGVNKEIGFAIHDIANPFNAEVISGVSDLLDGEGYLLSVLDAKDDAEIQRRQLEAFIRHSRGGLIWVPADKTPASTLELLRRHLIPTVSFLRDPGGEGFDFIGIKNAEAIEQAVAHLWELGHRKIAYFGGKAKFGVRTERLSAFTASLAAKGILDPVIWTSSDDKIAGRDAMLGLMQKHPGTTALVCNGDMVAIGALAACAKLGLTPGREISIVGFDNIQDARISSPPLTTLALDPYSVGQKLARALLVRISEPSMPIGTSRVPAELILRETTGPVMPR